MDALLLIECVLGLLLCLGGQAVGRLWCASGAVLLTAALWGAAGLMRLSVPFAAAGCVLLGGGLAGVCWRFPAVGQPVAAGAAGVWLALLVLYCLDETLWRFAPLGALPGVLAWPFPRWGRRIGQPVSGALLLVLSLFGLFTGEEWFLFPPGEPFAAGKTAAFLLFSILLIAVAGIAARAGTDCRGSGQTRGADTAPKGLKKGRAKY